MDWASLLQRDPDPAPVGSKFQTGLEPLKRDDHAFVVGQLHAAKATNQSAAGANGGVGAGKIFQFTQSRNASRQSHRRCSDRDAKAQTGNPERIVATAIRQDTAPSTGTHDQACLREYDADVTPELVRAMASPIRP